MDINTSIDTIIANFQALKTLSPRIEDIAKSWIEALKNGNKILFCGNGGSASDAQHLAAEIIGRYKLNRAPLAGICLNTDTSALTAIANDYGFENIFSRQIAGIGKKGDVLIGISTSGNSQNVINAFECAKELGIICIAFTGENGGKMKNMADICLNVPADITNNIQEMHIACGHIMCDYVERHFFA